MVERADDVGGNWYYGQPASSVYRSTHLISSKRLTEFTDFPMPDDYPEYPSHGQAWEYLRSYARHFRLYESIELNRSVEWIEPADGGWRCACRRAKCGSTPEWSLPTATIGTRGFPNARAVLGPGPAFVRSTKRPTCLRGRRVLVVGAGNSGCDIAVESAQNAAATFHSLRRGYHYLPKFLFGKPTDQCGEKLLRWRLPLCLAAAVGRASVRIALGRPETYGLPAADHKLFETHPIINSQMLYYVGHGKIRVKPDVQELDGDRVRFVDGSEEAIDVIIYATGFRITIPFIDPVHLNWQDGRPDLFLNVFHPQYDNLFVAGLIQPDSGLWGLVDRQAQLIARFVAGRARSAAEGRAISPSEASGRGERGGPDPLRSLAPPRGRGRAFQLSPAAGKTDPAVSTKGAAILQKLTRAPARESAQYRRHFGLVPQQQVWRKDQGTS